MNESIAYHNLMEDIVLQELESIFSSDGGCQCPVCRADVIALALNHLPPRYVTTDKGRVAVQLSGYDFQNRADIIAAISSALKEVRLHPHHNQA